MPIHDWSRVPAGLFHDFHQSWSIRIKDALNAGRLPRGVAALVEQRSGPKESDVLAIERHGKARSARGVQSTGGAAVPPAEVGAPTPKPLRLVAGHHPGAKARLPSP